ncbi:MAG TPA: glycosyl hydrolase [Ktedonobacteraceae bacterium]|nr:glycosyl hydrolase [Ktedonobacteraceae bacterium]
MKKIYLAMERELLVTSQQHGAWQTETHLVGLQPTCLAIDPFQPERVYCGTFGRGLWYSDDAGHTWKPTGDAGMAMGQWNGDGIFHAKVASVAVSPAEQAGRYGVVYAGTEPSAVFRSEDGGETWWEQPALRHLPSAPSWRFPPRPYTSHVRWITPDPLAAGRLFAAIEAGALVRSVDGGQTWEDRVPGGPFDTHTLVMHRLAPNRLYSAAGDGFMNPGNGFVESTDGGDTWYRPDDGLQHHYLWSVAVDPADPDTIIISASHSPHQAHDPREAEATIYRKQADEPWQEVRTGLPDTKGTVIPILASNPAEPATFYALTNKGLYHSTDAGHTWETLTIPWNQQYVHQHQQALAISED